MGIRSETQVVPVVPPREVFACPTDTVPPSHSVTIQVGAMDKADLARTPARTSDSASKSAKSAFRRGLPCVQPPMSMPPRNDGPGQLPHSSIHPRKTNLRPACSRLRTSHPKLRTSYSKLRTSYSKLRMSHSKLQTSYSKLQTPYSKLRTPYSRLRASHSKLRMPRFTPRIPQSIPGISWFKSFQKRYLQVFIGPISGSQPNKRLIFQPRPNRRSTRNAPISHQTRRH